MDLGWKHTRAVRQTAKAQSTRSTCPRPARVRQGMWVGGQAGWPGPQEGAGTGSVKRNNMKAHSACCIENNL